MSYQVLARKWRPKTFREMVGQEHVLKALINALDHNRLHHAYLFTGTRGVGKTTIARILAKCLNCQVGVSSVPCGQCTACNEINDGRFVDLIEVDAASRTKVEDTRELLDNVLYAPTSGRYKVFLIDEVHMLSTHSFNALLKTLEEPPPHVKFLLATTDPQKLPATILSRCLQFNLKNMSPERIVEHLKHVLAEELVEYDEQALWLLGRSADGSMRDAMSLTDQAIAFGSGKLVNDDVRAMLGTIDQSAIYDILTALLQFNGAGVLEAVAALSQHAPDYINALEELLTLLHRLAITQAVPSAVDNSFGDSDRVAALAGQITAEDVQLFYQMALIGRRDLPLAPDPRSGFEMVLLRMLAFKPAGIPHAPRGQLTQPGNTSGSLQKDSTLAVCNTKDQSNSSAIQKKMEVEETVKKPEPAVTAKAEPALAVSSGSVASVLKSRAPDDSSVSPAVTHSSHLVASLETPVESSPACSQKNLNTAISSHPVSVECDEEVGLEALSPDTWAQLYDQLGFGGVVGNIASHCMLERYEGDTIHLILDNTNATLFNEGYTAKIQAHLSVSLNRPVNLQIQVGDVVRETPAKRKSRLLEEKRKQAIANLQNDPNVRCLIERFSAILDLESVKH